MRVSRTIIAGLAAGLLLVSGTGLTAQTASAASSQSVPSAVPSAKARPKVYTPTAGITINNPLGKAAARRVNMAKIRSTIRSAPRGSQISIASWNIRSNGAVADLINAHRRGVSVRVIIDRGNANPKLPNKGWNRLAKALAAGNTSRPVALRSAARRCAASCRGTSGIAHTKLFLFSRSGYANNIVMYGSANLTDLASGYQWNDLYTMVNRADLYRFSLNVFNQMLADRDVANSFVRLRSREIDLGYYPYKGAGAVGDPVLNVLNRVGCTGATGGTGTGGRTSIRIAQTAINGTRGIRLAQKLHYLHDRGCDIKIIYAVMGKQVLAELRRGGPRGPVPFRQVVNDFNNDYVYERYLHTKVLTLSGVYGSNRASQLTWNGSANWTQVGLVSDESSAVISNNGVRARYAAFVDRWFRNPPRGRLAPDMGGRQAIPPGVNPYKLIQVN